MTERMTMVLEREVVIVADTRTFIELVSKSVDSSMWLRHPMFPADGAVGRLTGITPRMLDSLQPDVFHVCWGTFPHESGMGAKTELDLVDVANQADAPPRVSLRNGSPSGAHLRTVWICALKGDDVDLPIPQRVPLVIQANFGGNVAEAVLHLLPNQLDDLPRYERVLDDSHYPPA